jgi:hypothetical protein
MFKKISKKFLVGFASLLIVGGVATQPVSAQEDETAIDVTFTFKNDYVLRGNSFANGYQKGPSPMASLLYFQPDIYFTLQHGWWFDIWASALIGNKSYFFGDDGRDLDTENGVHDYFDELDFSFGYSGSSRIGDVSVGFLTYFYANPAYNGFGGSDAPEIDLDFRYSGPTSPELTFRWLASVTPGNSGRAGRQYFSIKFSKDWDVGNDTSFNFNWTLGYHILTKAAIGTQANDPNNIWSPSRETNGFQGFSHLDVGIGFGKDFFSWGLTGIYRYNLELVGEGETTEYLDNANGQNHKLIWLTSISFAFGF